eukprot:10883395-Ditylum_brightwellii.AAC.1
MSHEKYMEIFVNSIDVMKHSGGLVGEHPKLGKYMFKLDGNENTKNATLISDLVTHSTNAYLTYAFLAEA